MTNNEIENKTYDEEFLEAARKHGDHAFLKVSRGQQVTDLDMISLALCYPQQYEISVRFKESNDH